MEIRKELPMQRPTRQAALRIRAAFLLLPDDLLLAKVLDRADYLDPDDEEWALRPAPGESGAAAGA
jgi:hypothetical protein